MTNARLRLVAVAVLALLALTGCVNVSLSPAGRIQTVIVDRSPSFIECNRIALIDVQGFIGAGGLWAGAGTTVADLRQKLDMAAADQGVRAVVLRIDSPGGGASASDTMFREVVRFREQTRKPVVAALLSQAASGGYYIALAADHIMSSPTAVTGSVGAVMNLTNVEGLYKILGLKANVIKSGEKKDLGSPFREMKPEERALLDGIVTQLAARFIGTVRERRPGMSEESLTTLSDGRVFLAPEALELGAIDSVGYLDEAVDLAREMAGVATADVILYRSDPDPNTNIYAAASVPRAGTDGAIQLLLHRQRPALLYLWAPGLNPAL
jgi:protease-4